MSRRGKRQVQKVENLRNEMLKGRLHRGSGVLVR